MSFKISGSKYQAEVTESNRQLVSASQMPFIVQQSWDEANASFSTTQQMPLPSPTGATAPDNAAGYPVHWVKNTSKTKHLIIEKVYWTADGGIVSATGAVGIALAKAQYLCQFFLADPNDPPTTNVAAGFPVATKRTNMGNGSAPELEQFAWDGVGVGLGEGQANWGAVPTAYNAANPANAWRVGFGQAVWNWDGRIAIPPGGPAILHVFKTSAGTLPAGEVLNTSFDLHYMHVDLNGDALVGAYK